MSANLLTLQARQYATNVMLLAQQQGSKLRGTTMEGHHVGSQASPVDQVAPTEVLPVVGRFQPMPRIDAAFDRRWMFPSDFEHPQLIDNFDKLRLIVDIQSSYVKSAVNAIGRQIDRTIIAAMFGTNQTGTDGTVATTFPAGQIVAVNFEASVNTGLTVAKLREVRRIFMTNNLDLDVESLHCGYTAKQHDDLLRETQVVNLDYTDKPVLVKGKVTEFLGFTFHHTELWPFDASGPTTIRAVGAWCMSRMYLSMWEDLVTKVSQIDTISSQPWQVYARISMGSTRTEEVGVAQILCSQV